MGCDCDGEQDGVPEGGLTDAANDALRGIAEADMLKLKAEQYERETNALAQDIIICAAAHRRAEAAEYARATKGTVTPPIVEDDIIPGRAIPVSMGDLLRHLAALRNGVARAQETAKREALMNQLAHLVAHYLTGSKCDGGDDPETDQRDGFTVPKGIDPQ